MMTMTQLATSVVAGLADSDQDDLNFERLLSIVQTTFPDSHRGTALTALYKGLQDRIKTAPASTRSYFHNAFPGGYLAHVLHVHDVAISMATVYKKNGGWIDFTKDELVFAALNHDLGKLGDSDAEYYVPQTSDWHRKTLGEVYKHNEDTAYFTVNDNTFMWLNAYGITYTKKEFLAIKLADGLYDEGNKKYLMHGSPFAIRTALPYIIHWADHMATIAEKSIVLKQLTDE